MRILALIIPLLVLLGGVRAGDGPAYPDTCDYTGSVMCGDQCIGIGVDYYCYCGSDIPEWVAICKDVCACARCVVRRASAVGYRT